MATEHLRDRECTRAGKLATCSAHTASHRKLQSQNKEFQGGGNKIKALKILPPLVFLGMGIVQIAATISGVEHLTGLPDFVCCVIALLFAWSPLLGTASGIYGAIQAWGWPWYQAVLLFTWHLVLFGAIFGVIALIEKVRR